MPLPSHFPDYGGWFPLLLYWMRPTSIQRAGSRPLSRRIREIVAFIAYHTRWMHIVLITVKISQKIRIFLSRQLSMDDRGLDYFLCIPDLHYGSLAKCVKLKGDIYWVISEMFLSLTGAICSWDLGNLPADFWGCDVCFFPSPIPIWGPFVIFR